MWCFILHIIQAAQRLAVEITKSPAGQHWNQIYRLAFSTGPAPTAQFVSADFMAEGTKIPIDQGWPAINNEGDDDNYNDVDDDGNDKSDAISIVPCLATRTNIHNVAMYLAKNVLLHFILMVLSAITLTSNVHFTLTKSTGWLAGILPDVRKLNDPNVSMF